MTGIPGGVVVVTGAASGIGRATAEAFHRRGATVVATDHTVVSMEQKKGRQEAGGLSLVDLIPCDTPCPEDLVQRFTLKEVIDGMIARLPQREASVLRMRFGLDDGQPKTASEVGEHHACSKERVRLIENRALFKLRSRSSNHALCELMNIDLDQAAAEDADRAEVPNGLDVASGAERKATARSIGKKGGATSIRRPQ